MGQVQPGTRWATQREKRGAGLGWGVRGLGHAWRAVLYRASNERLAGLWLLVSVLVDGQGTGHAELCIRHQRVECEMPSGHRLAHKTCMSAVQGPQLERGRQKLWLGGRWMGGEQWVCQRIRLGEQEGRGRVGHIEDVSGRDRGRQ